MQILRRTVYGRRVTLDGDGEERGGGKSRGSRGSNDGGRRGPPKNAKSTEKQVRAGKRKIEAIARGGKHGEHDKGRSGGKGGKGKGSKRRGR